MDGEVIVHEARDDGLRLDYILSGLQPEVRGGMHIHTGMSCNDAKGHFFSGPTDNWKVRSNL